jgi:hypothetical protein
LEEQVFCAFDCVRATLGTLIFGGIWLAAVSLLPARCAEANVVVLLDSVYDSVEGD